MTALQQLKIAANTQHNPYSECKDQTASINHLRAPEMRTILDLIKAVKRVQCANRELRIGRIDQY
jgi:hypothetical protein